MTASTNDKVPSYLFRGDEVPASQARDLLRDRFSANFDLILPPEGPIRVDGAMHFGAALGGVAILQRKMYGHALERNQSMIRRSQIDHYVITVSLEQRAPTHHLFDGERVIEQRVDQPLLFDMARPMRSDIEAGTDLTLFIPRDALDELLPRHLDLHGAMLGGATAGLLADHLKRLAKFAADLRPEEAQLLSSSTLHMIAASLAPMADSMALARPDLEHLLVRRIKSYVDSHLANPALSFEELCAAFHLSRSSLYRLLEPVGGVAAFIRERRLKKVYEVLVGANERVHIKRVADDFGFRSAAHFSRVFRNEYGFSPSEAKAHFGKRVEDAQANSDAERFASWLRSLKR